MKNLFLILLLFSHFIFAKNLPLFEAEYELSVDDSHIANEVRKLSYQNGIYYFKGKAKTIGLLNLFLPHTIEAQSQFSLKNNKLNTQYYQLQKKLGKKLKKNIDLKITNNTLINTQDKQKYKLNPNQTYVDKFNLFLALSHQAAQQNSDYNFLVIDKKKILHYPFEQTTATITYQGKLINSIKLTNQQKNKTIEVWLNPKQNYIPVKIKQIDDDGIYEYKLIQLAFY